MQQWVEFLRLDFMKTGDDIAHQMIAMHPRLIQRLKDEGLDNNARVPLFAGSASKAASAIIRPGQLAAEHLNAAAISIKAFELAWRRLYSEPIAVAREMRANGRSQAMGL